MKSHLFALALLTGCGAATTHLDAPVSITGTTGGVVNQTASVAPELTLIDSPPIVVVGDDAAAQIASVRCSHEEACTASERIFPSLDACITEVRTAHLQQLSGTACPKGVDPYALQRCIDDSRLQETCTESPESCSGSRLCRR